MFGIHVIDVLFHGGGGGGVSYYIIPCVVDSIVENGHIDPQITKIIQHSEICLPDTEPKTFFINQKVTFGADFGAFFLSKRNRYFDMRNWIYLPHSTDMVIRNDTHQQI